MKYYLRIIDTKPRFIEARKYTPVIEGLAIVKNEFARLYPYAIIDVATGLIAKRFALLKNARQYFYNNLEEIMERVKIARSCKFYIQRAEDLRIWRKNHE